VLVEIFLKTAAAPAILVAVLFFLFGTAPEPWRARVQSLLLAFGFCIGCYLLTGFPPWPPTGGAASLVWVALWFALFPWVAPHGSGVRYILRGAWVFIGTAIAIWSLREPIMASQVSSRNVLALMCLTWAIWSILERTAKSSHILTPISMAMLSYTACSLLFVLKGSILMSNMVTTMAVITGGVAAISWIFPTRISLHALFPFLSGFLGVCLITAYIFLEIEVWSLVEMAIPFFVLLLKDLFKRHSSSAFAEAVVCLAIAMIPLGFILYRTFQTAGPLY
jgi:hypothetical protein